MRHRQRACDGERAGKTGGLSTLHASDAFNQVIHRLGRLTRVDWERHDSLCDGFGDRKLTFAESPLFECSRKMERCVMGPNFNAAFVEHRVNEIIFGSAKFRRVDLDWVKVKHMLARRFHNWKRDPRDVLQTD